MASTMRSNKTERNPRFSIRKLFRFFSGKCNHEYSLIAAQPSEITAEGVIVYSPKYTIVLSRCERCSGHTTNLLSGSWTIDQLMQVVPEADELEELVRR